MSAEKLVDEWVRLYNDQDFRGLASMYTDDVTYACGPFGLVFAGRDAFVEHVQEYGRAVPDRKLTVTRIIGEGAVIAVEYDFAGTSSGLLPVLPAAGEPISTTFCTVLQLRGGRIAGQEDYLGGR
ncbi:nuclear transport factor 2 family protein [Nocardia sp. NPDC049149]|uniref:nuclear transport factor 2 family protein n=1 Tax=Nocardia sp. NPDC049149 TaxID=3364315 RepID=UPI0037159D30